MKFEKSDFQNGESRESEDSFFNGILPSSDAPPARSERPKADASREEIMRLKQKINSLEINIAEKDKKIGELSEKSRSLPPSQKPAPASGGEKKTDMESIMDKIGELEKKISRFSGEAPPEQARRIEESRLSARREIEELLKAVREQQKYSEMDRQMHQQLEKSWRRVEELEKKLMDFYGAILQSRREERESGSSSLDNLNGRLERIEKKLSRHEDNLSKILADFDAEIKKLGSSLNEQGEKAGENFSKQERSVSRLANYFDAKIRKLAFSLGGQSEKIKEKLFRQASILSAIVSRLEKPDFQIPLASFEQKTDGIEKRLSLQRLSLLEGLLFEIKNRIEILELKTSVTGPDGKQSAPKDWSSE